MPIIQENYKIQFSVPAGKYFIGDPCYILKGDGEWNEIGNKTDWFEKMPDPIEFGGRAIVWAAGTAYGDGSYKAKGRFGDERHEFECGVDAGLIGIVSVKDTDDLDDLNRLGRVVESNKSAFVTYDSDGKFRFGHISIDTAEDDSDD
ncbi:MAG TPA: hypothetical protein PL173_07625 [Saprospiraceae bacterium]|nr:hypothetical protein [Saprospiraceae bacterium]